MIGYLRAPAAFVLVALSTVAFTCGNRLPVVVNGLDQPVRVRSTWEDGRSTDHSIGPSVRAFLSSPPHHPVEVVITPPDGASFTATRDDAPELLGGPVRGPMVGWKVTPAGIQRLGEQELLDPGSVPAPGYALRAAMTLTLRRDGIDGRLELLEDDRIGHATRAALVNDPIACDEDPPVDALCALCAAIRHEPLRPAMLRLVDARGRERSARDLERPLA